MLNGSWTQQFNILKRMVSVCFRFFFINFLFSLVYLDDLEDFELAEFFEDTMNTEFNSILEDGSAIQLARLLLNYKKMVNKNQLTELKEDLQKRFPTKSNTVASSIKFKEPNQPEDDVNKRFYRFN